jgi:alpha-methylacyl-CoA racemase
MSNLPLKDLVIIDLSHRLPGPLGSHILNELGAKVIKIEDKVFSDPFKEGLFKEIDPSFPIWYEELNKAKDIRKFDFKSGEDQKQICNLIKQADACLLGIPEKIQNKLGITKDFKESVDQPFVFLNMKANKNNTESLHDLNAMAELGLLDLFLANKTDNRIDPPFLPIAGITFGQQIATELLANYIKAVKSKQTIETTSYLLESASRVLTPFWSNKLRGTKQNKFLHNGLYPCYSIYKTQDGDYIALAAVEEKFWISFCQLFELEFSPQDRFKHDSNEVFSILEKLFLSKTSLEIKSLTSRQNICLSFLR